MRRNLRILCLALTITLITGLTQAQSASSKSPENQKAKQITCAGNVVDEKGQPIAGVKVTLNEMVYNQADSSYDVKLSGEVTTDTSGAFSLSQPAESDSYRFGYIVAQKEGLALDFARWIMREDNKDLQMKLGQAKELSGIVVDESGKAVSDAKVSVPMLQIGEEEEQRGISGPVATKLFTSTTDERGNFTFTGIPADATAEFLVSKSGMATISTFKRQTYRGGKMQYAPGQADIKLVLPIEAKIEGIVVDKSAVKPVSGVEVMVTSTQDLSYFRPKQFVSKEDGTFSIGALAPDRYTLGLVPSADRLADWAAEPVEVETSASKTKSDVKIELSKGGILEVVITEAESKKPIEKASVSIRNQANNKYFGVNSDKDGVARIRLTPGQYQLDNVYKQRYSSQRPQDAFTIEEGKTEQIKYVLTGQPKITGIVRDEKDKPLKGVKLIVCPMGGDDINSDADGKFEITWDLGGWGGSQTPVMYLIGRFEEGNLAEAVEFDQDTRTLDMKLKPGVTFAGKVVDPNSKGIANARIMVMLRAARWGSSIGRDMAKTDAEGNFEVKAIPSGQNYSINASAEGYGRKDMEVKTEAAVNNRLDVGVLTLPLANLSVTGVVVDANDKPVVGARIYCSGQNQPNRNIQTNSEGKFTLDKVCAGNIRISANTSGKTQLYGNIQTEGGATNVKIVVRETSSSSRYVPLQPPSLIGKSLPELKDLKVNLSPADANDKMMLVCFFDMEQRPSRYCIIQLAKQAEQLKQKGATVVAVQASKVDENALNEWVKKNNISFPIGMIQGDVEKSRFTWGVQSLPWLILTDSKHIVRAAGFRVEELNEKIGGITDAKR